MDRRLSCPARVITVAVLCLAISVATPAQADPGGGDAGNSFETATPIEPGSYSAELLGGVDPEDWYRFSVEAGQSISVTV